MPLRLRPLAILVLAALSTARLAAAPPPIGGSIAIRPKTASGDYDPGMAAFVAAVSDALGRRGFVILPDDGHAATVAELILGRDDVGTALGKAPVGRASVQPGAALGTGVGVAIPFSTGKSDLVPMRRTTLELRFTARDGAPSWHAAAVTVRTAGAASGSDARVAADLTQAVLGPYPVEPTAVIGVP